MKFKHWFKWAYILSPAELFHGLSRVFLSILSHCNPQEIGKLRNLFKGCRYNFTLEKIKWLENTNIFTYTATDMSTAYPGNYEPNELSFTRQILKNGDIFIDVGANIGLYTVVASKLVGQSGSVFAFEPSVREYNLLIDNIELNKLKNVKTFQIALSNYDGETQLYVAGGGRTGANTLSNSFRSKSHVMLENAEKVQVNKIDTIFSRINIPKITLIKIDVEGHEPFVLEGAQKTLQKYKPIIMLEVLEEGLKIAGSSKEQLINILKSLCYKCLYFTEKGQLTDKIPDYIFDPKIVCYNMVCIPNK